MIKRFEGTEGRRNLITALQGARLVAHNEDLATQLADVGELVSFDAGDVIITQGGDDNDVFFILSGQAEVLVNNRKVATRVSGDVVGEMVLLDPTEPRSATIIARTTVVVLKVTEPQFQDIANEHKEVWRAIAQVNAQRLRERAAFLDRPNTMPLLFLGCSTEGLKVAQAIQLGLKHEKIEVRLWTDGVFGPDKIAIDALMKEVNESDFAAFVFSPDDTVISRKSEYQAPRDNVIFELGLFMGKLDRNRTFIVKEKNTDVKIPTDLLNINALEYIFLNRDNLRSAVAPVCTELRDVMERLGVK